MHRLKPDDEPCPAPKLDAMPINEALRMLACRRIVSADDWFVAIEMPVAPDEVSPILLHPESPHCRMHDANGPGQ